MHSFYIGWSRYELVWFSVVAISLMAVFIFWQQPKARIVFLAILFLFLGFWRYSLSVPEMTSSDVGFYNGQKVKIKGVVCSEPDRGATSQKFRMCAKLLTGPGGAGSVDGKVLVHTGGYPRYDYGQLLAVEGKLQKPEPFQGFAYDKYLAKDGIYALFYYPEITALGNGHIGRGGEWYKRLLFFKNKIAKTVNKGLPEPEASLANAMLLGYKSDIPDEVRNIFSRAGLSHIIAISGLHIGILIAIIFEIMLMAGLSRNSAFYSGTAILFLYITMIGYPISAVRAGFMGFLVLLALKLRRLPHAGNFLIISAFVLLIVNPKLLADDIGFQLSFLAVAAILFFYPIVDKGLFSAPGTDTKVKILHNIARIMIVTFVIQLSVAPIVAYNFGIISFISPMANLLVLPVLPVLVPVLVVSTIVSTIVLTIPILPGAVPFILWPVKLILGYILQMGEFLASAPLAFCRVDSISATGMIIYYTVVLGVFLALKNKLNRKRS
jgi:competence protein ComEC